MPSCKDMVALNAKLKNVALNANLRSDGGFERQTVRRTTLNVKLKMMVALNAKLKRDGGSEY